MSYGKYGMKNIGVHGNDFTNIAYNDPWFAAGMLAAQAWNKNYNDRGQRKADADVDAGMKANANDISAAEGQYGAGVVGLTPKEMIVQGKTNYETAKAANDTQGMQNAQNMAAMGRNIGAANGMNLDGYGANDSLESIFNMQSQKGGYSPEAKAENIGQGLYTLKPDEGVIMSKLNQLFPPELPKEEPKGVIMSKLDELFPPEPKEQPKGVFAAWEEKYGSPYKEEEPKGALTDGYIKGMAALEKSRKTPMDILNEMYPDHKITLGDYSKATGIDYAAQARADADKKAKERMFDPNYVSNMETSLRRKGYTDEQVETAMGRVREQVKNAQTADLTNKFIESQTNGDYLGAMQHISRLSEVNPVAAQTLGVSSPTFKNMWDVNNARQDTATAQGYRKENMGIAHDYSEKTAENNVGRQTRLTQATEAIRRQSQKMSREEAFEFAFDKYYEATGDKREAARLAAGIKQPSSNSNMNPQIKFAVEQSNKTIAAGDKWLEANLDKKITDYPGYEQYQVAQAIQKQYYNGFGNGNSSGDGGVQNVSMDAKGRITVYKDAISYTTDILEQNQAQGNKHSKDTMINLIRARTGDMANNIINNIDWAKWGYNGVPNQTQYGVYGTD